MEKMNSVKEKNLDFDTVIDRRNTKCIKYDFTKKRGMPEDILPLWVADMDFRTSSYVLNALENQIKHGIFGYSEVQEGYFEAVKGWMKKHYDWEVERKWLVKTPGIVFALALAVKSLTDLGDKVLIQSPVYYPFREVIEENGRKVIDNTLYLGEDNRYHIDFDDFEKKIIEEKIKLFFLCNPHNPVGRVWSREELEKLGDICYKHHVIVVSDEIHADFIFQGKHHVFAGLKKEYEEITITCTSPSKTFNLAGLQISNVFISNPKIKNIFKKQVNASGYSQLNIMGLVACEAAYRYGATWYNGLHDYIKGNIEYTKSFLEENIPNIRMINHEGTYLIWIDFRALGLSFDELEDLIINGAKLWLDHGRMFGESGTGFQRINVACPRVVLEQALKRLKAAVEEI